MCFTWLNILDSSERLVSNVYLSSMQDLLLRLCNGVCSEEGKLALLLSIMYFTCHLPTALLGKCITLLCLR